MGIVEDATSHCLKVLADIVDDVTKDAAAGNRMQIDAVDEFKSRADAVVGDAIRDAFRAGFAKSPKKRPQDGDDYEPKEVNPELYRRLAKPFANRDAAAVSLRNLFIEVGRARERCLIPDFSAVFCVAIKKEDGGEENMMGTFRFGDPLRVESLAAFLFGKAQAEREQSIAGIVNQSRTTDIAMDPRENKEAA